MLGRGLVTPPLPGPDVAGIEVRPGQVISLVEGVDGPGELLPGEPMRQMQIQYGTGSDRCLMQ
jgi:hypothetical protein